MFEAVAAQAGLVRALGMEPVVIGLADSYSAEDRARLGGGEVLALSPAGPGMLGYAPGMARALRAARLDLLHLHGIWTACSAAASGWARTTRRPYLVSPHGMLDPWILGRGRLKKAVAGALFERSSWRRAAAFHALTDDEAADIRAATGRDGTIVIPNAVAPVGASAARTPTVVYIGRIHPKKNLDGLIDGWMLARDTLGPLGARLRIAGWGAEEDVAALRGKLAGNHDMEFLGPVYGAQKAELLEAAAFLALPSHSEGLPVAILEAWAAGTPTIMTRHCHLPQGFVRHAAIECGTDAQSIAAALRSGFAKTGAEHQAMARAAAALIEEEFAPAVVSQHWREAYRALLGGG
ncbi:MAG: glycosyltransferase [Novosphingobium sp.]|nr:glycosyltransferase [Novosphingobium sp.]